MNSVRPVRKAIIPVAGLGTRMLPATKAIPKELLPIHDRPLIEHIVKEAIKAGIWVRITKLSFSMSSVLKSIQLIRVMSS